jgi:hypothetical protein
MTKKNPEPTSPDPTPVVEVVQQYKFTREAQAKAPEPKQTKKANKVESVEDYRKRQDQMAKLGLSKIAKELDRDELPHIALSIIADHGLRVLGGEWEIKNAEEATKIAKVWHDVFRLEMGEPTSISSSQDSESPDQRKNRFEELKLEAKRRVEGGLRAIAGDAG